MHSGANQPGPEKAGSLTDRAIRWVVAAGLLLRLWHYGRNPSMWHDEAATCVNILNKSFTGLFGRLDHSATGPSLLLWLQQLVVSVLGDGTYSLRLISVAASCAGLLLLARLCRSLLDPADALFAVAMAAFSDHLLWHAAEARHYSSDFLFGVLAILLFARTMRAPFTRRYAVFAVYAPFAILLSYPGMFICVGITAALLPEVRKERDPRAWAGWIALAVWMAALAAFFYFRTIRPQRTPDMDAAWANSFPDLQRPWTLPVWFVGHTLGIFDYFVRPWLGGVLVLPAIAGAALWWKGDKRGLVVLILVPMGCAVLASFIKSYPYTGARTMVYCLPGLALLTGAGLNPFFRWSRRIFPDLFSLIPVIAVAAPVLMGIVLAAWIAVVPWKRADTAGASAYVLAHRLPGDTITANHWEYEYYFRKIGPAFTADIDTATRIPSAGAGPHRLWMVIEAGTTEGRVTLANALISRGWHVEEKHDFQNPSVYLLTPAGP